jgi:hypothetical protein
LSDFDIHTSRNKIAPSNGQTLPIARPILSGFPPIREPLLLPWRPTSTVVCAESRRIVSAPRKPVEMAVLAPFGLSQQNCTVRQVQGGSRRRRVAFMLSLA